MPSCMKDASPKPNTALDVKSPTNAERTINDLGELGFIAKLPGTGLGDDCAELPREGEKSLLVSTDTLNEGIHFLRDKISAADLGYKSLTVNLSDIAAMGGRAFGGFLSLSLTSDVTEKWIDEFLGGVKSAMAQFEVELLGGDTNRARQDLSITWTVMGAVPAGNIKRRRGGRVGDIVAVTGALGDSAAGLQCLLENMSPDEFPNLLVAHQRPRPHLPEGQFLAACAGVTSMMDLSDGLWTDLPKLCTASGVGAEVDVLRLPVSVDLQSFAQRTAQNAFEIALGGGEDYVLLLTVKKSDWPQLAVDFEKKFARPLTAIGSVHGPELGVRFLREGHDVVPTQSFRHFLKN